jgi:hypothetical protein
LSATDLTLRKSVSTSASATVMAEKSVMCGKEVWAELKPIWNRFRESVFHQIF